MRRHKTTLSLRKAAAAALAACLLSSWHTNAAFAAGEAPPAAGPETTAANTGRNLLKNTGTIITAPLTWKKDDWRKFGILSGVTVVTALTVDKNRDNYTKNVGKDTRHISEAIKFLGDGAVSLSICGAIYAYAGYSSRPVLREAALAGTQSFIISGLVANMIKVTTHRPRPSSGKNYNAFQEDKVISWKNMSFPSGHTTTAFSMAAVIDSYYGERAFVPTAAYSAAALVGWSRFNDSDHWVSDIIFGGALGYYTGKKIAALHKGGHAGETAVIPVITQDSGGLALLHRF